MTPSLSTGPRTEAGKAISSRNATKFGLFSGDFIRENEASGYHARREALLGELAPVGILETTLADEIHRAMWRLRRCGQVEAEIALPADPASLEPGEDPSPDPMYLHGSGIDAIQKSVDRARAQAHRLLHKCTAELRRLQTERRLAQAASLSEPGISSVKPLLKLVAKRTPLQTPPMPENESSASESARSHTECSSEVHDSPPVAA